jgi:hypothetical protein
MEMRRLWCYYSQNMCMEQPQIKGKRKKTKEKQLHKYTRVITLIPFSSISFSISSRNSSSIFILSSSASSIFFCSSAFTSRSRSAGVMTRYFSKNYKNNKKIMFLLKQNVCLTNLYPTFSVKMFPVSVSIFKRAFQSWWPFAKLHSSLGLHFLITMGPKWFRVRAHCESAHLTFVKDGLI